MQIGHKSKRYVTQEQLAEAFHAIADETLYADNMPRRTADEAQDIPGFYTLLRVYLRAGEDTWSGTAGAEQHDGQVQVEEALHNMRKIAAIAIRAMIYNGVRTRAEEIESRKQYQCCDPGFLRDGQPPNGQTG